MAVLLPMGPTQKKGNRLTLVALIVPFRYLPVAPADPADPFVPETATNLILGQSPRVLATKMQKIQ